ncbi:hypothetical protein Tco_1561908, partial [Tanacetum coccineum]
KRVIVTESSIRRDLHLDDAEGTDCLLTATIFEELTRMGYWYETDIREKDEKSSKNGQNRARNGKAWKSQSQVKAKKSTKEKSKSNPEKSKVKPKATLRDYNCLNPKLLPCYNDDIFDLEEDIIENLLNLDKTKDLPPYHDNQSSGNPTLISEPETKSSSSSPTLTSIKESELIWEEFEAYLASDSFLLGNSNPSSPFPPFHNSLSGSTTSSSPSLPISETSDYFLEEFVDELALITFPPRNDDLPFDVESDLREIEYFLNHDPIKEMDSILEDLVDENSLDDNLDDIISEMFTDEHTLDYSSPPLWDDYDELFDLETVNDDTYDDPFYSKEEKIKDSKILIDELDPPRSSDFLPSPEFDSVFYEDFSEVDVVHSTNNEDKVFNPGILIHENLFEITNCATPEKNVKKATNASLILEDFNPPLYELPFHKEVPGLGALLLFSSENEEKVFNPRILTSKRMERTSVSWMFCISTSIPIDKFKNSPIFEASRARGLCPSITRASHPQLHLGIRYPNLID